MILNRKFGDYILLRRLAIGGQSEVFLAVKTGPRDFTRPIVIKALPSKSKEDEQLIEMFYREAFISSRFSHPNVINVHDARLIEDDHCMLMDFVNGQTVADIAQRGYSQACPPTLKQVVRIMADAADGLAYVHDFNSLDNNGYSVIHLDVSPQNIMVTYQGVGMLFDFGIAKIIGLDEKRPRVAGGKYAYMSPEQLSGGSVDPRSDIFSLGVILYELATGYRLFRRDSPQMVIKAISEEDIQPPRELRPDIPQALEDVIMRALERDPFKRYQSAGRFRDELLRFLESTSEGDDLRRGLGVYVIGMFKKERADIAMALRAAPTDPSDARPLEGTLTALAQEGQTKDPTMELLVPDRVREAARAVLMAEPAVDPLAEKRAERLQAEVDDMRKRQGMLYAAMGVLVLLTMLMALAAFGGGTLTTAAEPPIVAQP